MHVFPYSLIFILLMIALPSYAKNVALSFDDGLNPTTNIDAHHINQQLLKQLDDAKIQSIIFPSYSKIGDREDKTLVRQWGERGHLIGNHSAYHQNLNQDDVTAAQYIQSIQINESIFKDLPNYVYIYRFPFLKEGSTIEKRDTVRHWLKVHSYRHGNVSIDASDWFYNLKYLSYLKANDAEKIERLKQAYITHLLDRARYYNDLAVQTLGRYPDHVLLLHTNAINAAFLTEIIQQFKGQDWHFISIEQAYNDPLYLNLSENIPAGESAVWSIAQSKGIQDLRYPAENAPYEQQNLENFGLLD